MTVFIAKYYLRELNRTALETEQQAKQSHKDENSVKENSLINIADWKNTLESVDLKQFTMTRFKTNEKGETVQFVWITSVTWTFSLLLPATLPKIVSRQNSYFFEELLDAVSLPNVIYNLVQSSSTPLCGLMFIFSFFFIWLHVVAEYSFMANNMDFGLANNKVKQRDGILKRSAYVMDVYFLIKWVNGVEKHFPFHEILTFCFSGANLSYDFFKALPKDKLNVWEQLKHVLKLIVFKLFR